MSKRRSKVDDLEQKVKELETIVHNLEAQIASLRAELAESKKKAPSIRPIPEPQPFTPHPDINPFLCFPSKPFNPERNPWKPGYPRGDPPRRPWRRPNQYWCQSQAAMR